MKYNLHKSAHSIHSIYLHIYFVTTRRRNAISDEMAVRIREVMSNICTKNKSEVVEFGAEKNHVHLIVDLHPDNNISQLIGSLKSASSRMVRKEFSEEYYHWYPNGRIFWGRQKFAVSCGGAPLEIVKQYVSAHPLFFALIHTLAPQGLA